MPALRLLVTGTDTDVGKTWVTRLLVAGLRSTGRRVWLWKPVACGAWERGQAEDTRLLSPLVGDGQDPASLCRHQWPEPAAPHLAAAAAGDHLESAELVDEGRSLLVGDHDLVVEGAGGVLSPLTADRATALDLASELGLAAVVVTRPHLGTLNHSALSVAALRSVAIEPLGLVVNHHEAVAESVATHRIERELAACCRSRILATIGHRASDEATAVALADAVRAAHDGRPRPSPV